MGFLSDPDRRNGLFDFVAKFENFVSLLCYVASFCAFLALFHPLMREKTYFSENALLPNAVDLTFNKDYMAVKLEKEMREKLSAKRRMPHEWIAEKLESLDIETYVQNFTVSQPYMSSAKTGKNVYGIIRAPRHSSTESIVFAVPYDVSTVYKSVPLAVAIASHFREQIYWAKDLIFVFSDSKLNGLQAWLQAYHGHPDSIAVQGSRLESRGGSIQAALSIEISQSSCDGLNFILEGMNGQLPNLDLFNTMDKITRSNDGQVYLHGRRNPPTRDLIENCLMMLKTTLLGMWQQASGRPISGHALFLPYHIDALTVRCQPPPPLDANRRNIPSMGYLHIGRTIEGTTRSINNLLERFHQSFFYYVMPSTINYISIGMYIPALMICLLSSAIKGAALWQQSQILFHVFEQPEIPSMKVTPNITSFFPLFFTSFFLPSLVYFAFPFFSDWSVLKIWDENFDKGDNLFFIFLMAFLMLAALPLYMPSIYCPDPLTMNQRKVFKSIIIFLSLVGIGSNSVLNFSLTYFVAILAVPLMNFTCPTNCKYFRFFQKLVCIIISPLVVVAIMPVISFSFQNPYEILSTGLCYAQIKTTLMKIVHESYVHNSSLLWKAWLLFIPLWLMHWFLLWVPMKTEEVSKEVEQKETVGEKLLSDTCEQKVKIQKMLSSDDEKESSEDLVASSIQTVDHPESEKKSIERKELEMNENDEGMVTRRRKGSRKLNDQD